MIFLNPDCKEKQTKSRVLCGKNKGCPQKIMINQRTISPLENSSKIQSLPITPISFIITPFITP